MAMRSTRKRPRPGAHYWLTWSESRRDFVRRATGETLTELETEARFFGLGVHMEEGMDGVWFTFVEKGQKAPRKKRGARR